MQGHYLAHHLTLEGIGEDALTRSLAAARVDMNPHQVDASLFALRSPLSKGVLLADEVGLGKTIEAGLVIAQRWAEQRRRILLIVPASLRKQWQQELSEKFSLDSTIIEATTYREIKKKGHSKPFSIRGVIISSYEFAARKADELKDVAWDLVVIDEAHRLRNVYKKGVSSRAKDLKAALQERFKVLLTATPLQNSLMELYGLVSIIDDNHFGGEDSFKALYAGSKADVAALEALRERLRPVCHRTLRKQVQQAGHINFTRRHAQTFSFEPDQNEVLLYNSVSAFLKSGTSVAYGDKPNQLVHLQVMKILGSSTFAVSKYLEGLIERLERRGRRVGIDVSDDLDAFNETADEYDAGDEDEDEEEIDPEKLRLELAELRGYLKLARSIGSNAKGEMLARKLPEVLDSIVAKEGARKAVIFTESVRTQTYLNDLLTRNGFAGQTVLLNGSNADPLSKQIYEEWKARHPDKSDRSGSKSADMKAAIVESFKSPEKSILIATESGAEGINLQFCSLLINFDLPWNPQRVEQRIGRCHRYGQKIDVVVVNMLNLKNKAEERILELLTEKFHLFSGVFGSSDEVLGAVASGVDFERTVVDIMQRCRNDEDVKREFDELTSSLKDQIDEDVRSARARVLESLDQDVVARLKDRQGTVQSAIGDYTQRLLLTVRAELPGASFPEPTSSRFEYDGHTYTTVWPVADEEGWEFFRLADGNLAQNMVAAAQARSHQGDVRHLTLSPAAYPFGLLADVANLTGQSGWLRATKVSVLQNGARREEILLSGISDGGERLEPDTADRLLRVPSEERLADVAPDEIRIGIVEDDQLDEFVRETNAQNARWLDEEEARLDNYAKDVEVEIDAQIAALEDEVKELQRQRRSPELAMEDKLKLGRDIKRREGDMDDLKLSKFERRRAIRKEVSEILDKIEESLRARPTTKRLFTLRWSVV